MAITFTIELSVIVAIIAMLIALYLAIWSRYGLKEDISLLRGDTALIKQSIEERMRDLSDVVKLLIAKGGGTIKHKFKNIGEVKISVADMSEKETIYHIKTTKPIFKSDLLIKKAKQTNEFLNLEIELFGKQAKISVLVPTISRLTLPSTDVEVCSRFIAYYLGWLDTEYWTGLNRVKEFEKHLSQHLGNQKSE